MLVASNIRSDGIPWSDPVAFNRWRRVLGRVVTMADRVQRRTVDCGNFWICRPELVLQAFQEISMLGLGIVSASSFSASTADSCVARSHPTG